jgi:hypothetical protein
MPDGVTTWTRVTPNGQVAVFKEEFSMLDERERI